MAERNYQPPSFVVQDRRTVQAQQIAATDNRPNYSREVGDDSWRDRLFQGLAQNGAQVLNRMADLEFSNQYLEGQAAVGVIQSEEELQGNPLTRDWKVAGYRDTMGKLALADQQATFMQDLVQLREKNPEDLQAYLSARREKLQPMLAGLSREGRATMAGQMLLQDRDATKRWTSEHTKFVIDTKAQAVHTQWNVALRGVQDAQLQAATGQIKPEDFTETLRSTAGQIVGSVWMDESLPREVKRQLTLEMAQTALANDAVPLYDYLSNTPMPDQVIDGKQGPATTLISRLDGEQQLKLANAYREAYSRTNDARSLARQAQLANVEAQIDAGVYQGTYSELTGMLDPMVLNKTIGGERRGSIINKFLDKQLKLEQNSQFAQALMQGDTQTLYKAGKDIVDGVKALEQTMARRGLGSQQQLQTWIQVGRNGVQEGYKKVGEFLGTSIRQIVDSKDGSVLPQHADNFRAINNAIRQAEAEGLSNTRINVLSGLNEADRMFTEQVMRRVDSGASLDEAVQAAKKVEAADQGLSGTARAARASAAQNEVQKQIASIEPRGLWETGWDKVKAAFGSEKAAFDLKSTPFSGMTARDNFFRDSPTVQFYTEQTRNAVREEADSTLLLRPSATADEVMNVARANVAARTISTEQGPLILPRNVNLQTVFGVAPGNQAAIGQAIDGMLKSTVNDTRYQLSFSQGRLFAQEFDKNGARVGTGNFIDVQQIKTRIAEDTAKEQKTAAETFGGGKVVQADGLNIRYNGINSAGAPGDWMLGFRDNLIKHEGVRALPYDDASGKIVNGKPVQTVGVGVSSHNPNFPTPGKDGKITSEQATGSFAQASEDAAKAGYKIAQRFGVENKAGFQLMAELAYQSGTNFPFQKNTTGDTYRTFLRAVHAGNLEEAKTALEATAAYRMSHPERQKSYAALLNSAMYNPRKPN